jgi:hypothetical protein
LTIYAYYSWEIVLNVILNASSDNMQDWKGILEKAES